MTKPRASARKYSGNIDWAAVEEVMRRSIHGRTREGDQELCSGAHQRAPSKYRALYKRVRKEEQDRYRRSGGMV